MSEHHSSSSIFYLRKIEASKFLEIFALSEEIPNTTLFCAFDEFGVPQFIGDSYQDAWAFAFENGKIQHLH